MATENLEENAREAALRLCIEEEERRKTNPNETHERSIIVLGSKAAGKTTMIYRFLEKDEIPKPTIAMDYSFGRKGGKSLTQIKNIVHIWEVGHLWPPLVSAAVTGSSLTHSPHHTTIVIMLDLSKPELLWPYFEDSLSAVKDGIKMSLDEEMIKELKSMRHAERGKELEGGIDLFPMKLCIIGGKYDEFKELDLDKRELISKALRTVAHSLGASLYYHSAKDKVLIRRTKDVLSHYGFGAQLAETKQTDVEKPLSISTGIDSFALINLQLSEMTPTKILDTVKQIYVSRIPQIAKHDEIATEDPSNDPNFSESVIDRLRAQREEEVGVLLENMREGRIPQIPIPDPS